MKDFFKTALATLTGIAAFCIISVFLSISLLGTLANLSETRPVVPQSAILTIDMSKIVLSEQTQETDILTLLQGADADIHTVGTHDVIRTINTAVQGIRIWQNQTILRLTDTRLDHTRFIHLIIQLHFLDDGFKQAFGIGRIIYGKIWTKADGLGFYP